MMTATENTDFVCKTTKNKTSDVFSLHLTGVSDAGLAGVCWMGVSGAEAEADPGTRLYQRVRGDTGRHAVRFMAGR